MQMDVEQAALEFSLAKRQMEANVRLSIRMETEDFEKPPYPEEFRAYIKTLKETHFFNNWRRQIAAMKNHKFENTEITYFDMLNDDIEKVAEYVQKPQILQELKSRAYQKLYPSYVSMFKDRLNQAFLSQHKMDVFSFLLEETAQSAEADDVIQKICQSVNDENVDQNIATENEVKSDPNKE